jgi:hypothetical protein
MILEGLKRIACQLQKLAPWGAANASAAKRPHRFQALTDKVDNKLPL